MRAGWLLALALVVSTAAGCAAPPPDPAPLPLAGPHLPQTFLATLTRVEPDWTPVDLRGRFDVQPCRELQCVIQDGLTTLPVERNVTDAAALLWRADLTLEWTHPDPRAPPVHLSLWALSHCPGSDHPCRRTTRELADAGTSMPARIAPDDLFLRSGETGLQVRLDLERSDWGSGEAPLDVEYHLQGRIGHYHAVAEPIEVDLPVQS